MVNIIWNLSFYSYFLARKNLLPQTITLLLCYNYDAIEFEYVTKGVH